MRSLHSKRLGGVAGAVGMAVLGQVILANDAAAQFSGVWSHNPNWITGMAGGNGSVNTFNLTSTTLSLASLSAGGSIHGTRGIQVPTGTWQLTFDWQYVTGHSLASCQTGYYVNSSYTLLATSASSTFSGSVVTPVLHGGDWFAFEVISNAGPQYWDTLNVSKFTVPAPGSAALVAMSSVLGLRRRRAQGT